MIERYPVEELMGVPSISRYRVSPDGNRVAYVHDATGQNELYILDIETGSEMQISAGQLMREDPGPIMWTPDGKHLLFQNAATYDVMHTIQTIDMDGTVETVLDADGQIHLEDVSPDGRMLLFHFRDRNDQPLDRDLYLYDRKTGNRNQLTDYEDPVRGRNLFSPDGTQISYQVYRIAGDQENSDAYVVDTDGTTSRKLTFGEEGSDSRIIDWHPDGRRLLVMDDTAGVWRPGVYSLVTDEVTWYGSDEFAVTPMAFLPDGTGFLAGHYRDVITVPALYTLNGDRRELALDQGVAGYPTWVKPYADIFLTDSDVVLVYSREDRPSELIRYDLVTDTIERLVEADYGTLSPESFVKAEYVTYESDDREIGALLYRPDTDPSPAVVHIHGGPEARAERSFDPYGKYAQFFVSRGYTVLQPNFRGSTGRGSDFRREILGDWGGVDAADVAAGGRWLQSQDWVDEGRCGVFGQSYGAYSVLVQLTKYPTLWTAGIAWNGPTTGYRGEQSYSPLANVADLERPLLMLAGENDPSIDDMRQFRNALTEDGWTLGGDFEYHELTNEGHHSRDTEQQIQRFRLIEDFLQRQL